MSWIFGAESSRPGAQPVSEDGETRPLQGVLPKVARSRCPGEHRNLQTGRGRSNFALAAPHHQRHFRPRHAHAGRVRRVSDQQAHRAHSQTRRCGEHWLQGGLQPFSRQPFSTISSTDRRVIPLRTVCLVPEGQDTSMRSTAVASPSPKKRGCAPLWER